MAPLLFPGAAAVVKASKSCSAAITSKVSLPLTAALLAGIARNTACFPAIRFYDALMNWAISIHSQEVYRTRVFVLLEKAGGVSVGTWVVLPGTGRGPVARCFSGPSHRPLGAAAPCCHQEMISVKPPACGWNSTGPPLPPGFPGSVCFPSACGDPGAAAGEGLRCPQMSRSCPSAATPYGLLGLCPRRPGGDAPQCTGHI